MKTILNATHETTSLQVLCEMKQGICHYSLFVNGIEVTGAERIKPVYKAILVAMVDDYSKSNNCFAKQAEND
jgi:hypothetical protein